MKHEEMFVFLRYPNIGNRKYGQIYLTLYYNGFLYFSFYVYNIQKPDIGKCIICY